ncbi:replication initiator protein RctB domain-containing protein [Plesiomonas sp.]|uniref:replication initiator protein RctB domain-containing protein n=1 Tax=Plesiomonas sp. TaxID=2486279 RepID=UPI003F3A08E2
MLIYKNECWIEDSREKSEGSLIKVDNIHSDYSNLPLPKSALTFIHTIIQQSVTTEDHSVSVEKLTECLTLSRASVRQAISRLKERKVLIEITNFSYVDKKKSKNKLYMLTQPVVKKVNTSVPELASTQIKVNNNYPMSTAATFPVRPLDLKLESVSVIPDHSFFSSLFGMPDGQKINLMNNLPPTGFNERYFEKPIKLLNDDDSVTAKLFLTTESIEGVFNRSHIRFLYALVFLSIRYHMDISGLYASTNQKIKNITPIHTDHLLNLLGKSGNKEARDEIVNLFKRIENTKVGISCDQALGEDMNVHNSLARFFEVEGVQYVRRRIRGENGEFIKNNKGNFIYKDMAPHRYDIKWRFSVLKSIFERKMFYLLPVDVISYHDLMFRLYLFCRGQSTHRTHLDMDLALFNELLSPDLTAKAFFNLFEKTVISHFKSRSNEGTITITATGVGRGLEKKTYIKGEFSGISGYFIFERLKGRYHISASFKLDESKIFYHSHSEMTRAKLELLSNTEKQSYLTTQNFGHKAPIHFNNKLPDMSTRLEDDTFQFNDLNNDVDLKFTAKPIQKIRIDKRRFSITVTVGNAKFSLSKYSDKSSLDETYDQIHILSLSPLNEIKDRIELALTEISMFESEIGIVQPEQLVFMLEQLKKITQRKIEIDDIVSVLTSNTTLRKKSHEIDDYFLNALASKI